MIVSLDSEEDPLIDVQFLCLVGLLLILQILFDKVVFFVAGGQLLLQKHFFPVQLLQRLTTYSLKNMHPCLLWNAFFHCGDGFFLSLFHRLIFRFLVQILDSGN